jgi:SAM-dependent methyltransferase
VTTTWEQDAATFFDSRADSVTGRPSLAELCYVSGRDPRVWEDGALYESMIASICAQAGLDRSSTVLEVGCAGGFLALGLAPRVAQYVGVDVSAPAIELARRLDLPNAEFRHVNGKRLPFEDDGFDAAISYDVVTNFPDFDAVARLVRESVRVVRPGGRVLIGSVPDRATEGQYVERVAAVGRDLEARYGPVQVPVENAGRITSFYFDRDDFVALGRELGMTATLLDIHADNPYAGFRFNVVYEKRRP